MTVTLLEQSIVDHLLGLADRPTYPRLFRLYYGGWSLQHLRQSQSGKRHLDQCRWDEEFDLRADPGYYDVYLSVAATNQTLTSPGASLGPDYNDCAFTPVAVGVTAALILLELRHAIPTHVIRMANVLPKDGRLQIHYRDGRLHIESRPDRLVPADAQASACHYLGRER